MQLFLRDFPITISLSVSSVCNAQCIWCPIGLRLNTANKSKFLSPAIVDKIVSDCKGREIEFFLADMGEPLMNPDFKEIVTKCRSINPIGMYLSTNFSLMNEDMSKFILDNNFNVVGLNIDGVTEEGYYAVKHLPLKVVINNLINFINMRQDKMRAIPQWKPPSVCISITTQARYYFEIGEPERITIPDETRMTYEYLRNIIQPGLDLINPAFVITWAERKRWNRPRDKKNTICTNIYAVGIKCCIDTDGNMIVCCQDYDSDLKFGNVIDNTIDEIWHTEKRLQFISKIINNDYAGIGLPCSICQD